MDGRHRIGEDGHLQQVQMLLSVGQVDRALNRALEWLSAAPDSATGHLLVAVCLAHLDGHEAKALHHVEQSLALDPERYAAHVLRGELLFKGGRFAEAEQSVLRAVAIDPADPSAHAAHATFLSLCDFDEEALARCEHALSLDPSNARLHRQRAALLLQVHPSRWSLSEDAVRTALRLDPESALNHALLGTIQMRAMDNVGAESSFRASLRIDPGQRLALRGLSELVKGSSPLYRPMLAFGQLMSRLGPNGQLGVLFSLWILYSSVRSVISPSQPALGSLLTVAYFSFCAYTWFSEPLTRALLKRRYPWLD